MNYTIEHAFSTVPIILQDMLTNSYGIQTGINHMQITCHTLSYGYIYVCGSYNMWIYECEPIFNVLYIPPSKRSGHLSEMALEHYSNERQ